VGLENRAIQTQDLDQNLNLEMRVIVAQTPKDLARDQDLKTEVIDGGTVGWGNRGMDQSGVHADPIPAHWISVRSRANVPTWADRADCSPRVGSSYQADVEDHKFQQLDEKHNLDQLDELTSSLLTAECTAGLNVQQNADYRRIGRRRMLETTHDRERGTPFESGMIADVWNDKFKMRMPALVYKVSHTLENCSGRRSRYSASSSVLSVAFADGTRAQNIPSKLCRLQDGDPMEGILDDHDKLMTPSIGRTSLRERESCSDISRAKTTPLQGVTRVSKSKLEILKWMRKCKPWTLLMQMLLERLPVRQSSSTSRPRSCGKNRRKDSENPWDIDKKGLLLGQKAFESCVEKLGFWTNFEQQILHASVRLVGEDLKLIWRKLYKHKTVSQLINFFCLHRDSILRGGDTMKGPKAKKLLDFLAKILGTEHLQSNRAVTFLRGDKYSNHGNVFTCLR
jgi:hypothetical protein